MNHSTLRRVKQSPAHFKYHRDHRTDNQTTSKRRGTAAHELLLEPDKFEKRVMLGPINPKTGACYGDGTKAWDEFAAANPGRIILTEEEIDSLRSMVEAANKHEDLGPLLAAPGESEVCIVWDCPITGLRCKARIDRRLRTSAGGVSIDLKTCESADDVSLSKSLVAYGYGTQDAFYSRGRKALGLDDVSVFAAIESERPHGIRVYRVGGESRRLFDQMVIEWLSRVAHCQKTGEWPGYDTGVIDVEPPTWFFKQFSDFEN